MTEISPSINYIYCVWLKFSTQKPETNTTNKTHNQGGHLAKQLRHHLGCPHPMALLRRSNDRLLVSVSDLACH